MAHMRARIVTAKVSKALALYPKECIFVSFFSFSGFFWVLGFSLCFCFASSALAASWVRPGEKRVIGRKDVPLGCVLFCLLCQ